MLVGPEPLCLPVPGPGAVGDVSHVLAGDRDLLQALRTMKGGIMQLLESVGHWGRRRALGLAAHSIRLHGPAFVKD